MGIFFSQNSQNYTLRVGVFLFYVLNASIKFF